MSNQKGLTIGESFRGSFIGKGIKKAVTNRQTMMIRDKILDTFKISDKDKVYIKACLRKGEKLTETPRIRISTIHSSKGSQSENVMLLTETMKRPYSMWRKNNSFEEDEARVFYVGLTRSQQNLHLIHPMFSQGYPLPVR